jgi:peptidoglycan/xylan/chitin deacetylase (PgdA/CDA1 family)
MFVCTMFNNSKIIVSLLVLSLYVFSITEPHVAFSLTGSSSGNNTDFVRARSVNHHSAQPIPIRCDCVVFRMDDVQDRWIEVAQLAAMNVFISKNQSLTLGIIMSAIGNDTKIIGQINAGLQKGLFELALHGWAHVDYTKLTEQQQLESLRLANEKMKQLFGNTSDIFITPYGPFNNDTISAMGQLGIRVLSASLSSEEAFDKNSSILNLNDGINYKNVTTNGNHTSTLSSVYHVPATIFFKDDEQNKKAIKIPIKNILSYIDNDIKKYGYSVVVFHPQDFVSTDQNGNVINSRIDPNQLKDLSTLVDQVLSKGIKIISFSKLLEKAGPLANSSKAPHSNNGTSPPIKGSVSPSLDSSETQQWINNESNTKIEFNYFPAVPIIGNSTDLRFIVKDLKTGNNLKNLTFRVTILNESNIVNNPINGSKSSQDQNSHDNSTSMPIISANSSNGDVILKHKFPSSGTYQLIVRVNSGKYPLALASFEVYII